MTEFCETCPLRDECTGPIVRTDTDTWEYRIMKTIGPLKFPSPVLQLAIEAVAMCEDEEGNISRFFRDPDPINSPAAITQRIENCDGPINATEKNDVFPWIKHEATVCGSLPHLSKFLEGNMNNAKRRLLRQWRRDGLY